jgi:tetratricopeptide (TPR) repeat protein
LAAADSQDRPAEAEASEQNEQRWQERWNTKLKGLADQTHSQPKFATWTNLLSRSLHVKPERNATLSLLCATYSKSLNYWGVRMQRLGRWREAGSWFERSIELSPENLAARINLAYNQRAQNGNRARLEADAVKVEFGALLDQYHTWLEVLNRNGLVDEPSVLFEMARSLLASKNNYQAVRQMERCVELAQDWLEPKLWLALGFIDLRDFSSALRVTDMAQPNSERAGAQELAQLLFCRTTALHGLGRTNEALDGIAGFVRAHDNSAEILAATAEVFAQNLQFEESLLALEPLLRREPNDPKLLERKGMAELQLGRYESAIATFGRALAAEPTNDDLRLQRAVARMGAGQLNEAGEDYQALLQTTRNSPNALYGLGGIAWRKHETNAAIQFYRQYISASSPESPQYKLAAARLKHLQPQSAK